MRTKVAATATHGGFLLRLTEVQKELICEALRFHADRPGGDRLSVVRIGADRASTVRIMKKVADSNSKLQIDEIHVLFAALVSAPVLIPSEEAFYERIGFFREQAFELAGGLASAFG
ncbi:hypothetical protein [Amycolatopsis sp. GA6-003]|uniref:hypothetical protein n=1 Tax=Amycolatopsis sp. GA6-003 TaxID=2652444 RepID=UPI003916D00F